MHGFQDGLRCRVGHPKEQVACLQQQLVYAHTMGQSKTSTRAAAEAVIAQVDRKKGRPVKRRKRQLADKQGGELIRLRGGRGSPSTDGTHNPPLQSLTHPSPPYSSNGDCLDCNDSEYCNAGQ